MRKFVANLNLIEFSLLCVSDFLLKIESLKLLSGHTIYNRSFVFIVSQQMQQVIPVLLLPCLNKKNLRKLFGWKETFSSQRICFYYSKEGFKNFCQTEKKEVFCRELKICFRKRCKLRAKEMRGARRRTEKLLVQISICFCSTCFYRISIAILQLCWQLCCKLL